MGKKINILGIKFGNLLVVAEAPSRVLDCGTNRAFWKCECICGEYEEISAQYLLRGLKKRCTTCKNKGINAYYVRDKNEKK